MALKSGGVVDVSIVVVSYNTRSVLERCLRSARRGGEALSTEVIVVDNASRDGSAEMVEQDFPECRLIRNTTNEGFARANNRAFQSAKGRYILLLNPDAELEVDTLSRTVSYADRDRTAGVVGCRVFLPDGRQQSTIFRVPRFWDLVASMLLPQALIRRIPGVGRSRYAGANLDRVRDVEVVAGCFMLVRREVVEQVGGMDGEFFMYGEEAEWCHRIRKHGWRVVYYPGASVRHLGGESARRSPEDRERAMAQGQLLLIRKTLGPRRARRAARLLLLRDSARVQVGHWAARLPRAGKIRDTGAVRKAALRVPVYREWLRQTRGQGTGATRALLP